MYDHGLACLAVTDALGSQHPLHLHLCLHVHHAQLTTAVLVQDDALDLQQQHVGVL